jgi:nitrogenase molybdenum-cofactor synthesis protein NifE
VIQQQDLACFVFLSDQRERIPAASGSVYPALKTEILRRFAPQNDNLLQRKAMSTETCVIFEERKDQIHRKGQQPFHMDCNRDSLAGAVSQRACVFCGSRVVLYPIADALHLVHGPIGCAAYTWDIRGALSSGPELHRLSFSTDLQEQDVIFGGEAKLTRALEELIDRHHPKAAFVYSTCIVGLIGDDLTGVCKKVSAAKGIPVIPVQSEGFKGNKRAGYHAACEAMFSLVGTGDTTGIAPVSLNILGDFNLAGEIWIIRDYFARMGIQTVANITGDGRVADLQRAHGAALNVVQCSGATMDLAKMMQEKYGIPFLRVSYFGVEDMADSLYAVARFFQDQDPQMMERTQKLVRDELAVLFPRLQEYRRALTGKKAAIYVGGAFKAFSLVKAFRHLGMQVVLVGSQTGTAEDYQELQEITDEGTIIVDDSNPLELSSFLKEKDVDIFVGGVKERPIAYKLGVGFCDHNHERKEALEGFVGMLNFAREVFNSVTSPVWRFVPRKARRASEAIREGREAKQ